MTILHAGEHLHGDDRDTIMECVNFEDVEPLDLDFSDRDFSVLSVSHQSKNCGSSRPTSWINTSTFSGVLCGFLIVVKFRIWL